MHAPSGTPREEPHGRSDKAFDRALRHIDRAGRSYSFDAVRIRAPFAHCRFNRRRLLRLNLECRFVGYRPNLLLIGLSPADVSEAIGMLLSTFAKALKGPLN